MELDAIWHAHTPVTEHFLLPCKTMRIAVVRIALHICDGLLDH